MNKKTWFGGALVLSIALGLAMNSGAWARFQERGSGKDFNTYGSGQGTGSGSQYGKQQKAPAGCKADDPMGVCAPPSAAKKTKPATGRPVEPETSR